MIRASQHLGSRLLLALLASGLLLAGYGCEGDKTVLPPRAPTVTITAPAFGDTCSSYVQLIADAENADLVTFYADTLALGIDDTEPFESTWNSMTAQNGPHNLVAEATGAGGAANDTITVTVFNTVTIIVTPESAYVFRGHHRQFRATVEGTVDTSVTWHIDEGKSRGTISSDGLFTAPETLLSPLRATIRATSVAEHAASATASVLLLPDLRIEAEAYADSGGAFQNLGGDSNIRVTDCSAASGRHGVDGMDLNDEWIKIAFTLPADLCFHPSVRSATTLGETRTYEILFESSPVGAGLWPDTLHTSPGLGYG